MNAKRLLWGLALVACTGLMYSCNDDDDDDNGMSIEQADAAISTSSTSLRTTSSELANEDANKIFSTFEGFLVPAKSNRISRVKTIKHSMNFSKLAIDKVAKGTTGNTDYLSYTTYVEKLYLFECADADETTGDLISGTYTLDSNGERLNFSETPTDGIVFRFPYQNDTASIAYSNITTGTDGQDIYLTSINCTVKIGNSPVYTATYTGSLTTMNLSINIGSSYTLATTYRYSESNGSATTIYTSTIKKSGTVVYNENVTSTISETAFDFVGKLTVDNLEFRIKMYATLEQLNDNTIDYDDIVSIELYTASGDKVGKFEFENANQTIYFYYNDGTRINPTLTMSDLYTFCFEFFYDCIAQ